MACENIKNAFYALTGQVSPRLYNRISINDPWVAYVEKGEWPTGMFWTGLLAFLMGGGAIHAIQGGAR